MKIYRAHSGNFAQWRRFKVVLDGQVTHHLADGAMLEVSGDRHLLSVSGGGALSGEMAVDLSVDQVVVCELTANPKVEPPAIRLTVLSLADAEQRLLRFDRPPYVGGRIHGLATAVLATMVAAGISVTLLLKCIEAGIRFVRIGDFVALIFISTVGTFVCVVFGFLAACGLRGLYYYSRLPPAWRH